ncbi:hypothetical protein A3G56_03010 [Candidatus Falkowbacteria bacterium RIFCSPLOWO2_12_FULL_45_10]|uniref:Uncharacterized protein n=3 Tax=Candidatus Falkowiibacteriota TaxID=1752728 RepID=A0A1F5RZL4_9BACT|nr:MAG: hypothetical protein A3I35_03175 [Candidatus Falkowbacteria bacterium RIFCSPLOWO2_02_FULL_45_15]OGF19887.1 MAG: hypothetical protein A3D54_03950 [Candidatus Falkowbacteria bacterium RIFCSPHIGHO2_02_FULL_45_15]OGF19915.1 MAG: hypothetical protein A3G56_03010 [Candidatus Falkowbacteria bacterium RIFCSPLOWO2_12_FULL_45_10]
MPASLFFFLLFESSYNTQKQGDALSLLYNIRAFLANNINNFIALKLLTPSVKNQRPLKLARA